MEVWEAVHLSSGSAVCGGQVARNKIAVDAMMGTGVVCEKLGKYDKELQHGSGEDESQVAWPRSHRCSQVQIQHGQVEEERGQAGRSTRDDSRMRAALQQGIWP